MHRRRSSGRSAAPSWHTARPGPSGPATPAARIHQRRLLDAAPVGGVVDARHRVGVDLRSNGVRHRTPSAADTGWAPTGSRYAARIVCAMKRMFRTARPLPRSKSRVPSLGAANEESVGVSFRLSFRAATAASRQQVWRRRSVAGGGNAAGVGNLPPRRAAGPAAQGLFEQDAEHAVARQVFFSILARCGEPSSARRPGADSASAASASDEGRQVVGRDHQTPARPPR